MCVINFRIFVIHCWAKEPIFYLLMVIREMARKKAKHTIDKKMIIEAFADMAKTKNIDRDLLQGVLEETLSMIVRKKYGMEANFDIIVNMQQGDIEIYNNQSSGVLSSSSWGDGFACVPAGEIISLGDEIEFYALTTALGHG